MKIGITYNLRQEALPQQHALAHVTSVAAASPWADEQEEFDSPETVAAVAEALQALGHEVELLGAGEMLLQRLLTGPRPELVFNFAEGQGISRSREAQVPAVLEMLGIPYTGSDPLTLAVTLDKTVAKRLVSTAGVTTPRWVQITPEQLHSSDQGFDQNLLLQALQELQFPVIVKPAYEGSSKGILSTNYVAEAELLLPTIEQLITVYRQPILVEEFIAGEEVTVGVLGNTPPLVAGIMRIVPQQPEDEKPFVYSLEVKRNWQSSVQYECPAQLPTEVLLAIEQAALQAWSALGCRDVARIDFRIRDGIPYFLEVNPLPGLSPTSGDLVLLTRAMGISYLQLIERIVTSAQQRCFKPEIAQQQNALTA